MKLTEHEQRILAQIEQRLSQDTSFAATFTHGAPPRKGTSRARAGIGIAALLVGLLALVASVATDVAAAGAASFVLMVAGASTALHASAWRPHVPRRFHLNR